MATIDGYRCQKFHPVSPDNRLLLEFAYLIVVDALRYARAIKTAAKKMPIKPPSNRPHFRNATHANADTLIIWLTDACEIIASHCPSDGLNGGFFTPIQSDNGVSQ